MQATEAQPIRFYQFSLPEGLVRIEIPKSVNVDGCSEISSLFELIKRQIFREAEREKTKGEQRDI